MDFEYKLPVGRELLTSKQEADLTSRVQSEGGDIEALSIIVESNVGLVFTIAREKAKNANQLPDYVSAALRGLMIAAGKFDPTKGASFATYASWWINQQIFAERRKFSVIRLPPVAEKCAAVVKKKREEYETIKGREPTLSELEEELPQYTRAMLSAIKSVIGVWSLDCPVTDSEGSELNPYVLVDSKESSPLDDLIAEDNREHVLRSLDILNERQKKIIKERFGLNKRRRVKTLEELSSEFGLTRERIRQIQNQALRKLRKFLEENIA